MKNPRYILITGASSGIGAALAAEYAAPDAQLYLTGRNLERLTDVAKTCQSKGARVQTAVLDVSDYKGLEEWIASFARLDLAIINAGISGGTAEGVSDDAVRQIFSTNIGGVLNTLLPVINKLKSQPPIMGSKGQIAIMASVAGLRGLPSAPAYSATKACVLTYADALRGSLKAAQIDVSAICPGYVRTPLTDANGFFMPFIMSTEKAAIKIKSGLAKNRGRIAFPLIMFGLLRFLGCLPYMVTDPLFRLLPKK